MDQIIDNFLEDIVNVVKQNTRRSLDGGKTWDDPPCGCLLKIEDDVEIFIKYKSKLIRMIDYAVIQKTGEV